MTQRAARFGFAFMASMLLVACTQQAAIDSTGAAARNWCKSQRNCTVYDDTRDR